MREIKLLIPFVRNFFSENPYQSEFVATKGALCSLLGVGLTKCEQICKELAFNKFVVNARGKIYISKRVFDKWSKLLEEIESKKEILKSEFYDYNEQFDRLTREKTWYENQIERNKNTLETLKSSVEQLKTEESKLSKEINIYEEETEKIEDNEEDEEEVEETWSDWSPRR